MFLRFLSHFHYFLSHLQHSGLKISDYVEIPALKSSFFTKKGACGNFPGPKTCFSTQKRRLRQHSRTKNVFFFIKKGACGNVPGPKTCFFHKKRRLRQRTRTKNIFFGKKKRLRQHSRTKKKIFFLQTRGCQVAF